MTTKKSDARSDGPIPIAFKTGHSIIKEVTPVCCGSVWIYSSNLCCNIFFKLKRRQKGAEFPEKLLHFHLPE
jgi:hypothetical protein